ncbi:MAG: tetratricopeptide repeat protein, partial [Terriglobales bacterium]
ELEKARKQLAAIAPIVNDGIDDQVAYSELLKAEVAAASGDYQTALQFLKPPAPEDNSSTAVLTCEALAHIYQRMGKPDEAIAWYRQLLGGGRPGMLSWEPQQQLFDAYYNLALDYRQKGDRTDAMNSVHELLTHWSGADPNLPLLRDALRLRNELAASH